MVIMPTKKPAIKFPKNTVLENWVILSFKKTAAKVARNVTIKSFTVPPNKTEKTPQPIPAVVKTSQ